MDTIFLQIDGALRPANQLAIVRGTTHYTLAVDPTLAEIVKRFLRSATLPA
jgi:hypothetical protein